MHGNSRKTPKCSPIQRKYVVYSKIGEASQTLWFTGYCHHASNGFNLDGSLESLCSSIESDSPLFFIFRTRQGDKKLESEACPFKNIEYAFSYSTRGGAKVCQQPPSRLDTCTDEAKMVFQFQACPDVPGSERTGEFSTVKSAFTQLEQISTFFSPVLKGLLGKSGITLFENCPKKVSFCSREASCV